MSKHKLVPVEPTPEMLNAPLQGGRFENRVDLRPSIYRAMLAAAPAVQGEPVAITDADILAIAGRVESCPVSPWWLKDDVAIGDVRAAVLRFARALLATVPQPTEQQPDRDVRMLAASLYQACGAYDMPTRVLDVLSAAANGEPFAHMIDGLLPCVPPSDQNVKGEPVGWVNSDELDNMLDDRTATLFPVRTGFHGKPVYAAPQPAEQQPDVARQVEALTIARETIAAALRANELDYFATDADIARYVAIQRIDTALSVFRKGAQP